MHIPLSSVLEEGNLFVRLFFFFLLFVHLVTSYKKKKVQKGGIFNEL